MTIASLQHATSIIGGAPTEGDGGAITRHNPARPDEAVGVLQCADERTVGAAIDAATSAATGWRALRPSQRAEPMSRLARAIDSDADALATLITLEEGKTWVEARAEVGQAAATFAMHAEIARHPTGEVLPSGAADTIILSRRVPLGVVAVVTPWNFPIVIPAWKRAPALIAGNAVVWKPASDSSLVAARLMELIGEAGFPPGVCNLLIGRGDIGARLIADRRVDAVTFTGSEQTGAKVAAACAERRARCQLELGGHSPAIVFADADLDHAANCLVAGFAGGSGQKCTATRRILVAEAIRAQLIERLATRVDALRVGDPMDPDTDLGPLVSAEAATAVRAEIEAALHDGAECLAQAPAPTGPGHYVAPTLLAASDHSLRICHEEVFGPVTTLLDFDGPQQAWRLANATRFGLAAAVFTSDLRTTAQAAERIEAGIIKINAPTTGSEIHAPFGGTKSSSASGYREQGLAAREFFSETRTVYVSWPS